MKPELIKWIDRRIGTLLCRFFSLINFLIPNKKKDQPTQKVLFIKLIEQGASVLAFSALNEAVEQYGKENVYFLVFKENRPILDLLDVLEPKNILEINNDSFIRFALDIFKAILKIRYKGIDSCIDMEFFSRASVLIAFLTGARKRAGLFSFTSEHPYRGSLITHKIHYNPYVHVSNYYLMLVRALKEKPVYEPLLKSEIEAYKTTLPKVTISNEVVESLKSKISLPPDFDKIVVLNPNAGDMLPIRKWETENFKEIMNSLRNDYPKTAIVFTGVAQERARIDALLEGKSDSFIINSAGLTSLMELMALYQISNVVVTNDSGPAHFASMFNTNVVVLFGPETPDLFAPKGEHIHVIYKKLACSPCVNVFNHRFSPCKDNVCMKTITANEVYEKVKAVI